MRIFASIVVLGALAACSPGIPDSAAGAGFDDYDSYQERSAARDAELQGGDAAIRPPAAIETRPLDSAGAEEAGAASGGGDILPPEQPVNTAGISRENDFDVVSERRNIETDAERIARNRAQYRVVEPTALPSRDGSDGPNIVAYALRTDNPVGSRLYERGGFNAENRFRRNCAKYTSGDQAQQAFLSNGGPEKDRLGLDPDGDGYACSWNPVPFRAVRSANRG